MCVYIYTGITRYTLTIIDMDICNWLFLRPVGIESCQKTKQKLRGYPVHASSGNVPSPARYMTPSLGWQSCFK